MAELNPFNVAELRYHHDQAFIASTVAVILMDSVDWKFIM